MSDIKFVNEYVPFEYSTLKEGDTLTFPLYIRESENYILLCQDCLLDSKILAAIRKRLHSGVYIKQADLPKAINFIASLSTENRDQACYIMHEKTKNEVKHFISEFSRERVPSYKDVNGIFNSIQPQLEYFSHSQVMNQINIIRSSDEYLFSHSVNVALLNGLMGRKLGYSEDDYFKIITTGFLHDVGKVLIPRQILDKPGKLTDEEFEIIKLHPEYSKDLLLKIHDLPRDVVRGVYEHHERVSGQGYPNKLTHGDICDFGRITAISDVYDAMVSKRCYKDALPPFKVLNWLYSGRFSDLDYSFVNVFLACLIQAYNGVEVVLSDGSIATVVFIDSSNIEYPVVKVADKIFSTTDALYCKGFNNVCINTKFEFLKEELHIK